MLNEMSQTEEEKYCMVSLIYGIKKIKLVNIIKKTQLTDREQASEYQWGEGRGVIEAEVED